MPIIDPDMKLSMIIIMTLMLLSHNSIGQGICNKVKVTYDVDTLKPLMWYEKERDSILRMENILRFHIREDIFGLYRITYNDSLYFSGKLRPEPSIGYSKVLHLRKTHKTKNVLTLENNGNKVEILLYENYNDAILSTNGKCGLNVIFANRAPFKG